MVSYRHEGPGDVTEFLIWRGHKSVYRHRVGCIVVALHVSNVTLS